jgi:hypothetical protein
METLVQQLPALIGVLIGALASYLATSASERARWRRTQAIRWDEARARAYAEYADSVKRVFEMSMRIAAHRGLASSHAPLAPNEGLSDLAELGTERASRWESVLLLGDPTTVAAARDWHRLTWQMDAFVRGTQTDDDERKDLLRQADTVRDRFYDAARSDLGVTGGRLPSRQPPP